MISPFERNKLADTRAAQEEAALQVWKNWIATKHPEIRAGEAMLREFRDHMMDSFLIANDEDFEYALKSIDTRYMKQRVPTEAEIKQELTKKILDLLQKGGTGYDAFNLNTARKKMEPWNTHQLSARLDEITRAQQMSKQPIAEVQKILKDSRQYVGYPQLPTMIVPTGQVHAVVLNAGYIRRLDVYDLKKLNRLYGSEQVNARLAGKD